LVWNSRIRSVLRELIRLVTSDGRPASRRQEQQRAPVAPLHRHLLHLLRIDVAAERRGGDFEQRASAVTVIVSASVDGDICRLTASCWPASSCKPLLTIVVKP
jgi:hypothetical protein